MFYSLMKERRHYSAAAQKNKGQGGLGPVDQTLPGIRQSAKKSKFPRLLPGPRFHFASSTICVIFPSTSVAIWASAGS